MLVTEERLDLGIKDSNSNSQHVKCIYASGGIVSSTSSPDSSEKLNLEMNSVTLVKKSLSFLIMALAMLFFF